jgi:glutathione synthase
MLQFRMLVLTDHAAHTSENSLYALVHELRIHPRCQFIDVASRGIARNSLFFENCAQRSIYVIRADEGFIHKPDGGTFKTRLRLASLREYDVILIRLPHPVSENFWNFLKRIYPEKQIINQPTGIHETSSKLFLLQTPELCPPVQACHTAQDVVEMKKRFPIVLKPAYSYGGQGIVKIEGEKVWNGNKSTPLGNFLNQLEANSAEYLGMQFLPKVVLGDKRIVVVNGKVLGASLRMPPPGSWMCNVAQGGQALPAEPDADELAIASRLIELLTPKGVIFFGFDTLVNDEGRRVLSEINTLSIGGLTQIANFTGRPVVKEAADLIWDYVKNVIYGRPSVVA